MKNSIEQQAEINFWKRNIEKIPRQEVDWKVLCERLKLPKEHQEFWIQKVAELFDKEEEAYRNGEKN